MHIAQITEEDVGVAIDLHLTGLKDELELLKAIIPGKSANPVGKEPLVEAMKGAIRRGECVIFLAKEGTEAVGYCLLTKKLYPLEVPQICGCINGVFIRPNFRRQGLGQRMVEEAFAWFKGQGITFVELTHMIHDDRARLFWEKMGFIKVQYSCLKRL